MADPIQRNNARSQGALMDYFRVDCSFLESPSIAGASDKALAAWVRLMRWSARQESNGIIDGCQHWPKARFVRAIGVTHAEVKSCINDGLASFDSTGNLMLYGYIDSETEEI